MAESSYSADNKYALSPHISRLTWMPGTPARDNIKDALDCPAEEVQLTAAIPEKIHIPFPEIVDYLNEQTGSAYRHSTKRIRELIRARWNEGFTLADMKKVIDLKTAEWLHDPHWSKYLRPETLFGTKLESYLNPKADEKGVAGGGV